jgi:voltage-gated potassium channel
MPMNDQAGTETEQAVTEAQERERWQLLRSLDSMLEGPLVVLAFIWLAVLLLEFVIGTDARLDLVFYAIWVVFIAEVVIKLLIAPSRLGWLRANWLKLASLAIPALRVLRVFTALGFLRAGAVLRSASLLRLLTSVNRGIGAIGRTLDQARFAYVLAITALVIVVGASGILFFESPPVRPPVGGAAQITSYGEALWWTAMTMTTVGSEYSPVSAEGRLLAWLLSIYALGVFGYVTATIASHFFGLGSPAARPASASTAATATTADDDLRAELAALRAQIASLSDQLATQRPPPG